MHKPTLKVNIGCKNPTSLNHSTPSLTLRRLLTCCVNCLSMTLGRAFRPKAKVAFLDVKKASLNLKEKKESWQSLKDNLPKFSPLNMYMHHSSLSFSLCSLSFSLFFHLVFYLSYFSRTSKKDSIKEYCVKVVQKIKANNWTWRK